MLTKAVDQNLIDRNPYREFKLKKQQGRLTYLSSSELQQLENHHLGGNKTLEKVRDIFLFSVYTGLRHSDADALKKENIELDGDSYWINFQQKKTGEYHRLPMLRKAVVIYDKYKRERNMTGYVLPRLSHQKLNLYLKVIAEITGISKPLSHHVARHTAATTIFLQNGISLETTSKLLGHTNLKSTQIYAKVTNLMLKRATDELDKLI
jgi:site-specific recombinase XerD